MPNLSIHWKGYPQRRLPRIRVRSISRTPVRLRSIHRIVPADSFRQPMGAQYRRDCKKQKFCFRRHRGRKSRSSSSVARARSHASVRARQHLQVFGWDADIASKANTSKTKLLPSSVSASQPSAAPEKTLSQTTVIASNDGAGGSACRSRRPTEPERLYSLEYAADVPVYWPNPDPASFASNQAFTQVSRRTGEDASTRPLNSFRRRHSSRPLPRVGKSRTYDARIDPRSLLGRERPAKSFPANPAVTRQRVVPRNASTKSWQGNSELRRILSAKVSNAKPNPQLVNRSIKSVVQSLLSDPVSCTPSQRKALSQFIKELELYLQATKSLPKQSLVPSPSTTTVSVHTIEEFRPYQSEFRSAGLAVTAADQLGEASIMVKLKNARSPPPTPPKDGRYSSRKSAAKESMTGSGEGHLHHKSGSIKSFDTETTVMDFTPPHEPTSPCDIKGRRRSSSDHTIMAFTSSHGTPYPEPEVACTLPTQASTKKSLPWLRKKGPFEEPASPLPKDKSVVTPSTVKSRIGKSSKVLPSPVTTNAAVAGTTSRQKISLSEYRTNEIRREDKKPNPIHVKDKHNVYKDAAIQAVPEPSKDYLDPNQGFQYAHATAQTPSARVGPLTVCERDISERRAPYIQKKSKTVPISHKKCADDLSEPACWIPSSQSFRKRHRDRAMQTDLLLKDQNVIQSVDSESNKSSFRTNPKSSDLNHTFPYASPSPFQRSPVTRTSLRSFDQIAVKTSRGRDEPLQKQPAPNVLPSPSKQSPRLAQPTQVSAHVIPSVLNEQMKLAATLEPAYSIYLEPKLEPSRKPEIKIQSSRRWTHICTRSSSLECQQCAPSEVSTTVSEPTQKPIAPRLSQRSSRQSPAREGHWATTFESELEETIQNYNSPEERFKQRKVIEDTIEEWGKPPNLADPTKNPTQSRIRLRPPLGHAFPEQERSNPAVQMTSATTVRNDVLSPSTTVSSSLTRDSSGISNRAVFRGLNVATAAACDEDVAKWIEELTGTGIRRFLADLSALDGMGINTLTCVARRAAIQKRRDIIARKSVREKTLQERGLKDGCETCVVEIKTCVCHDREMGIKAGNETVIGRHERERSGEEVLDDMVTARDRRSREGLRERAIRMGWRDRTVSG